MLQSYPFLSILASIKTIFVVGFSLFCHATRPCPFAPSSSSPSPPYYISAVFSTHCCSNMKIVQTFTSKKVYIHPPQICIYLMKNIKFAFEIRQIKKQNLKKKKNIYPKDKQLIRKVKTTYRDKTYLKD